MSHPHVEWHETSAVLGDQAFREINDSRRIQRVKASHARERQHELQALRKELEERASSADKLSDGNGVPSTLDRLSKASEHASSSALSPNDANQAFMPTLDASPAIAAPVFVHTNTANPADAFAATKSQTIPYQPRQTRISGEVRTPIATALVGFAAQASDGLTVVNTANDSGLSRLPESIQSAAIAIAVGDKPAARAQLKAAFAMAPNKRVFAQAWLECLRACDEKQAYEAAAQTLAQLHDFAVPPYESSVVNSAASMAALEYQPQAVGVKYRFAAAQELDAYAANNLFEIVKQLDLAARQHREAEALAVISFVQLKLITTSGAQELAQALKSLNNTPTAFVLQGGTVLLDVLLDMFTTQQSLPHQAYWHAALQACRLLGRGDNYDELLTRYYSRYIQVSEHNSLETDGISAEYLWESSKAKYQTFNREVDDTANLAFSIESDSHKNNNNDSMLPVYTAYAQPASTAARIQSLRVVGEGTQDRIVRVLELADSAEQSYTAITLDLSRMAYIQFEAAVALLNWAQHKREQGIAVVLQGHGLLSHALFEQISLADAAELHPHYF